MMMGPTTLKNLSHTVKRAGLRAIVQGFKRAICFVIFKEAIQTYLRQTVLELPHFLAFEQYEKDFLR